MTLFCGYIISEIVGMGKRIMNECDPAVLENAIERIVIGEIDEKGDKDGMVGMIENENNFTCSHEIRHTVVVLCVIE